MSAGSGGDRIMSGRQYVRFVLDAEAADRLLTVRLRVAECHREQVAFRHRESVGVRLVDASVVGMGVESECFLPNGVVVEMDWHPRQPGVPVPPGLAARVRSVRHAGEGDRIMLGLMLEEGQAEALDGWREWVAQSAPMAQEQPDHGYEETPA